MHNLTLVEYVQLIRSLETRLLAAASEVGSVTQVLENLHLKVEGLKQELARERQRRLAKPIRPGSDRHRKVLAKIASKAGKEAKDGQDASK